MRFPLLLPFVLFVACSGQESQQVLPETTATVATVDTAATQTSAAAPSAEERGAFVVRKGGSEVYRETFHRAGERVTSTIVEPEKKRRVEQVLTLRADGTVQSVQVQVYDASNNLTEQWTVRVEGGSATVEGSESGGAPQTATMDVPPGTIPIPVSDSVVMVEQILRHRTKVGGDSDRVPVLSFGGGKPSVDNVTVAFSGTNTARVQGTDTTLDVVTDGQGHLVSATDQKQGVTVERVEHTN